MKHLFTLCLLAAPTLLAQAQAPGQVAGQLRDEYQQPLPDTTAGRAT